MNKLRCDDLLGNPCTGMSSKALGSHLHARHGRIDWWACLPASISWYIPGGAGGTWKAPLLPTTSFTKGPAVARSMARLIGMLSRRKLTMVLLILAFSSPSTLK